MADSDRALLLIGSLTTKYFGSLICSSAEAATQLLHTLRPVRGHHCSSVSSVSWQIKHGLLAHASHISIECAGCMYSETRPRLTSQNPDSSTAVWKVVLKPFPTV